MAVSTSSGRSPNACRRCHMHLAYRGVKSPKPQSKLFIRRTKSASAQYQRVAWVDIEDVILGVLTVGFACDVINLRRQLCRRMRVSALRFCMRVASGTSICPCRNCGVSISSTCSVTKSVIMSIGIIGIGVKPIAAKSKHLLINTPSSGAPMPPHTKPVSNHSPPTCPHCGFAIFNRRYPKCEACGHALSEGLVYSAAERSALQQAEETEAKPPKRRRDRSDATIYVNVNDGWSGTDGSDGGSCE